MTIILIINDSDIDDDDDEKMMMMVMITIVDDWVAAGEDVHVLHRVHRRNWRPTSEEV